MVGSTNVPRVKHQLEEPLAFRWVAPHVRASFAASRSISPFYGYQGYPILCSFGAVKSRHCSLVLWGYSAYPCNWLNYGDIPDTKQRTYSALRDPNGLPWGETVVLEAECADPTGWNPTTDQWAPATVVLM
jgi:hypothetical protein